MQKNLTLSVAALALCAGLTSPTFARPMTPEDLAMMKRLAAPVLSPDGKLAVYQLRETDMAANKGRTDLYLLSVDDKAAVPVKIASKPDKNEHDPVFSPDGKSIYYISNESGSDQIWRVATSGGNPVQISKFKNDVGGFKISPDAKKIAGAMLRLIATVWIATMKETVPNPARVQVVNMTRCSCDIGIVGKRRVIIAAFLRMG
jgi:dipeptidyl aminopeptidase/acylaminoacyl peptidase